MAKVFKHVGLWLAVLFAALCTAGLLVVHAQGEDNALYQTVLGKAVNFGITSSSINQSAHMQTNFATKSYEGNGQYVQPDLSGNNTPGDFLVGSISQNKLKVTGAPSQKSTFYVTKNDKDKIDINSTSNPNIDTRLTQTQINDYVDDLINNALAQGSALAKEKPTANVKVTPDGDRAVIDTTGLGSKVIIDGDKYLNVLNTTDGLTLKKDPGQDVVFNITKPTSGTTLNLRKYKIDINGQTLETDTPMTNTDGSNTQLDNQAQHIFFNINGSSINTVSLQVTTGVFLANNASVSIDGTSSGWIVTNRSVSNPGGEWHFIHQGPAWVPTGCLKLTKSFINYAPTTTDLTKINFTITGPNNYKKIVPIWST
jgi:hypothetical protein